ncbi:hypothetical protein CALVIDRAFT_531700 [Calocera viscosa TUFC12733]|uniref:Uncharacterized protein n=1 Tax=Calocera viscosa (strain TUFC12733) TaxID=1330018 RepID=A0A167G0L6_CALVF|nr:hypothetical protein CALVIDRAFT_531700 [Calocera viscosa TUFC12733]
MHNRPLPALQPPQMHYAGLRSRGIAGSSGAPPQHQHQQAPPPPHAAARQLFDPSRDDRLRFRAPNRAHAAPSSGAVGGVGDGVSAPLPSQPPGAPVQLSHTSSNPPTSVAEPRQTAGGLSSNSSNSNNATPTSMGRDSVLSGMSDGNSSSLSQSLISSSGTGTAGTTGPTSSMASALVGTPATSNYMGQSSRHVGRRGCSSSGDARGPAWDAPRRVDALHQRQLLSKYGEQRPPLRSEDSKCNALFTRMKKLYENITERKRESERVLGRVEEMRLDGSGGYARSAPSPGRFDDLLEIPERIEPPLPAGSVLGWTTAPMDPPCCVKAALHRDAGRCQETPTERASWIILSPTIESNTCDSRSKPRSDENSLSFAR